MPLNITSRAVSASELGANSLVELLGSATTAFIHEGSGLVGWGEAVRLSASGENRFAELEQKWLELVAESHVSDEVQKAGSGLIAFGSFSFADQSATESVLVVPEVIVGFIDQEFFITTVNQASFNPKRSNSTSAHLEFQPGAISEEQFVSNVHRALELIAENKLQKIVLARDLVAKVSQYNPNQAIAKLANKYPTCYSYLVDGMFGASPELLVSVSSSVVAARVLAGTAGRGTDVEVDKAIGEALANSHKNLAEHKFAIDSLTASMSELCSEITASEKPFSLALPNLWHLASDVRAELKQNTTSLRLLSALHPSAAVAGTPRETALELITEIEKIDRGRYAGPVGWVAANGDGVWAIALRGAQLTSTEVRAFAGCGIVAESDAQSELAETNLKFKTVLENL